MGIKKALADWRTNHHYKNFTDAYNGRVKLGDALADAVEKLLSEPGRFSAERLKDFEEVEDIFNELLTPEEREENRLEAERELETIRLNRGENKEAFEKFMRDVADKVND